ncbi:cryptochrome/photolyase family protein [Tenacibaculum aquimarinum]|uniref:cryptochrome/photolyase family protein n=1 Tax=Tenacibaculum aquimarinum TaxID=2910675 RepID=UPI0028681699|nr:cryptochrome/photolyase family protein [Tenacibaculum aquimarinum]
MKKINLVFPNQLFEFSPLLKNNLPVYLIEEFLFFKQLNFHKQKIAYHRATMKHYEAFLASKNIKIVYISSRKHF